jgi:spore photoproduct lyase
LELKTKTTNVAALLDLRGVHQGKTVVSFSVNAPSICVSDEAYTASLEDRLKAAGSLAEAGYRIGFHFDPLVHFLGWEDEYRETVRQIFNHVRPADIAWISLSTLRYRREMQQIMEQRFPASRLPFGEQFLAVDNKLRYIQPLRFRLTSFLWNEIKSFGRELPVYMCMESAAAWRHIAGGPPSAGAELTEIFSRRGKLPVVSGGPGEKAERRLERR